jgi:flagellar protein FlaI
MSLKMGKLIRNIKKVKYPDKFEEDSQEEEDSEEEGVSIPTPGTYDADIREEYDPEDSDLSDTEVVYPLTPQNPDDGEMVYAWAHIYWDENEQDLVYKVIEPEIDSDTGDVLKRIEEIMERSFDISLSDLGSEEADNYLLDKIDMIVDKYNISLTDRQREVVRYYTKRDYAGLGKLEPLLNDTEVEDISCDGCDIPVYVYHRNPEFGSLRTDLRWSDPENLNSFVMKLAQRCGRSISVSQPLLDGSLPDGSRVQATLATDIARKGSNFTIRRFTQDPLTPVHMMEFETENAHMYSYLWTLIEHGKSVLVSGTTGAGKTSQLNSLSLFIRPEKKIVSIEDTPELRLPHEHWVPEVARSGFGSSADKGGIVSMDNLLKESLRQRPEYIIVGEVRGAEAYILFQQMATGHTGLSTIHADSLDMLENRLTTKPIELSGSLIETLDMVMMIKRIRRDDKYIRRVTGLYEIISYNRRTGIEANKVFEWNSDTDEYSQVNDSVLIKDVIESTGKNEKQMKEELVAKQRVLKYMKDEQIKNYRKVGDVISSYYNNPDNLMSEVNENLKKQEEE